MSNKATALPSDLVYKDIARATLLARSSAAKLVSVNASSVFNASRLESIIKSEVPTRDPNFIVGDLLWLHECKCFATIVSLGSEGHADVLLYECFGPQECRVHVNESDGNCWRLACPLRSRTILLQSSMRPLSILLPRAGAPGSKLSLSKPWQRCYRVAQKAEADSKFAQTSAAEELLEASADA